MLHDEIIVMVFTQPTSLVSWTLRSLSIPWAETHHGCSRSDGSCFLFRPVTVSGSFSCLGWSDLSQKYGKWKRMFCCQNDLSYSLYQSLCNVVFVFGQSDRVSRERQMSQGPGEGHTATPPESPWGRGEREWEVLASLTLCAYHCGLTVLAIDCMAFTAVILSFILQLDVGDS